MALVCSAKDMLMMTASHDGTARTWDMKEVLDGVAEEAGLY